MNRFCSLSAVLLLVSLSAPASLSALDIYGRERERGWWWYEEPPVEEDALKEEVVPQPPSVKDLAMMETDQLKNFADQALKIAVRDPSEANVHQYYLAQDVIRRKALAFSAVSEMVWQKYPELSTAKDSPVTAPGRRAMTRAARQDMLKELSIVRERFALLYFRSDSCPFCLEQDGILAHVRRRIGWEIEAINMDVSPEVATRLGVETTPSLMLIERGNPDFFPVAAGVTSAVEIEERLYRAARLLTGASSPKNFNLHKFQEGGGFDARSLH